MSKLDVRNTMQTSPGCVPCLLRARTYGPGRRSLSPCAVRGCRPRQLLCSLIKAEGIEGVAEKRACGFILAYIYHCIPACIQPQSKKLT